jgi:SET domain-containing protein
MYVDVSGIHGMGAFARRPFRMGEVVCKVEGVERHYTEMTPEELALSFESKPDHYILPDAPIRYMNHSDSPNCRVGGLTIRAARDISQGEELTIDYRETTTWKDYRLPWS